MEFNLLHAARALFVIVSVLTAGGCGVPETGEGKETPSLMSQEDDLGSLTAEGCTVRKGRELLIRDLSVVSDPLRTTWAEAGTNPDAAAWTFGKLLQRLAGAENASTFAREFLQNWMAEQSPNNQRVAARTAMRDLVILPWLKASGDTGVLKMDRAPFRLLAIVNRVDLRQSQRGNAGELRFVYGVLGPGGDTLAFTLIVEFKVPASSPDEVRRWARDWHALGSLPFPSARYNRALQALTDKVSGTDAVARAQLGQIRTNEIQLGSLWQLRQFDFNRADNRLIQVPLAQTPDRAETMERLVSFVNENETAILENRHVVPLQLNGLPFRAGATVTRLGKDDFWADGAGVRNENARHRFSLNTCNGCHGGETGSVFVHINIRTPKFTSILSPYLTGTELRINGHTRTFNELDRRAAVLARLACAPALAAADLEAISTEAH